MHDQDPKREWSSVTDKLAAAIEAVEAATAATTRMLDAGLPIEPAGPEPHAEESAQARAAAVPRGIHELESAAGAAGCAADEEPGAGPGGAAAADVT
jgi:hypothetical protein